MGETRVSVRWVIQSNMGSAADVAVIDAACSQLGLPCTLVSIVPFSDDVPDVPTDMPAVFYGTSRFVSNVHRCARWRPGVFFDEESMCYSSAHAHYGARMLSRAILRTSMQEFAGRDLDPKQHFFVRPDHGSKAFAGTVMAFREFQEWCDRLRSGGFLIGLDTPIIVADPVDIDCEWRLFVVEGQPLAGSRYRRQGRADVDAQVPDEVREFAGEMAALWSPADAFVLDVAQAAGRLNVLEVNSMNSSGFYASDIPTIVRGVSSMVGRRYAQ